MTGTFVMGVVNVSPVHRKRNHIRIDSCLSFLCVGSHGKSNHKESPKTKAEMEKDRHVSKTGRNDVVKKGGSGHGNWGGPEEEIKEALASR